MIFSNTDLKLPTGLKGAQAGGCRLDLAIQARYRFPDIVVPGVVVFAAEAKRVGVHENQAITQLAFAIHCTLIMLIIEWYNQNSWTFQPPSHVQQATPLPDNYFVLTIYYWKDGLKIYGNYPTIAKDQDGRLQWKFCCSLLREYKFQSQVLSYRDRFTLYR